MRIRARHKARGECRWIRCFSGPKGDSGGDRQDRFEPAVALAGDLESPAFPLRRLDEQAQAQSLPLVEESLRPFLPESHEGLSEALDLQGFFF